MRKIPLAWLNLIHKPWRFLITIAGIASAVVLMFLEFGIQNAMYDSQMSVVRALDADLLVLASSNYSMSVDQKFPFSRLVNLKGIGGIEKVTPVYIESRRLKIRNPQTGKRHPIRILAFELGDSVFLKDKLDFEIDLIRTLDSALIDLRSKDSLGDFSPGTRTEVGSRRITITGTFSLGTDFVNDGNLIMSARSYQRLFPDLRDEVSAGLIRLKPNQNPEETLESVRRAIPDDISIVTLQEAIDKERAYWKRNTFIGFVFGIGTIVGFVVGVTICSQILYAGVVDNMPQYATLKAIGYSDSYLVGSVLRQALTLSILGFIPGLTVSFLIYELLFRLTGLPMEMTLPRGFLILFLTVGMCSFSAAMAIRQILYTDPAEVFK